MRLSFVMIVVFRVLSLTKTPATGAGIETLSLTGTFYQSDARQFLNLINDFRLGDEAWYWSSDNTTKIYAEGLTPMTWDYTLEQIAMQRVVEAAVSFSHERPDGTDGFSYTINGTHSWGENLAGGHASAQSTFVQLKEDEEYSDGQMHRRNMLAAGFTAFGAAHFSYNGYHYWAIEFGYSNSGAADTGVINGTYTREVKADSGKLSVHAVLTLVADDSDAIYLDYGKSKENPFGVNAYMRMPDTWGTGVTIPSSEYSVTWSSEDESVLRIEGKRLYGASAGLVDVSASIMYRGKTIPAEGIGSIQVKSLDITYIDRPEIPDQKYTGSEIRPLLPVYVNGVLLQEGRDYDVEYWHNIEPGVAVFRIYAKGNYRGETGWSFQIVADPTPTPSLSPTPTPGIMIWETDIEPIPDQTYTGKQISPTLKISYNGRQLIPEQDYTFSYGMNIEPGQGYVNLWGIGEFDGSTRIFFNIVKAGQPTPTGKPGVTPTNVPTPTSVPRVTPGKGVTEVPTPTVEPGLSPSPEISDTPEPSEEPEISETPSPSAEPETSGIPEPTENPTAVTYAPSPFPTEAVPSISAPNPSMTPTSEQTIPTVSHLPEPESGVQKQHAHGPLIVWILLIVIVVSFILFLVWK